MQFEEIEGKSLEYFTRLVKGRYEMKHIITLAPGEAVAQEMFIG